MSKCALSESLLSWLRFERAFDVHTAGRARKRGRQRSPRAATTSTTNAVANPAIAPGTTLILILILMKFPQGSLLEYVLAVDELWSRTSVVWGEEQTQELCLRGRLSRFLPAFISRLDPGMQDQSFTFWNEMLHDTKARADRLPGRVAAALDTCLSTQASMVPERPDLISLWFCDFDNPLALDKARRLGAEAPATSSRTRYLTLPDDARLIAESGLLLAFWRPYIGRLAGSYTGGDTSSGEHRALLGDGYMDGYESEYKAE